MDLATSPLGTRVRESTAPRPEHGADGNRVATVFLHAVGRLNSGDAHGALGCLQAAVVARPDNALYRAYLGWALVRACGAGQLDTARQHLHRALELDPEFAMARWLLQRLPHISSAGAAG